MCLSINCFVGTGIVCMLPWDMMMTVDGYWHYKLAEEDQPDNSTELTR